MLKSKKNVFWEALLVVILIFSFGFFIGAIMEQSMYDEMNSFYLQSEISFSDGMLLNNLVYSGEYSCEELMASNILFADRIYDEAKLLEQYSEAQKLDEKMDVAHKKYDLLRTYLWVNNNKILEKCGADYDLVIYLYEYEAEDITKQAIQNVWSKILVKSKDTLGNDVVLIPIAIDQGIISLDVLISDLKIEQFPAVVLNNKEILYTIDSVEEFNELLKK